MLPLPDHTAKKRFTVKADEFGIYADRLTMRKDVESGAYVVELRPEKGERQLTIQRNGLEYIRPFLCGSWNSRARRDSQKIRGACHA